MRNDDVMKMQGQKRVSGLKIIELYDEIKRLELDLRIHGLYRVNASAEELQLNEYLMNRTKQTLSRLYKSQIYEK